MTWKFHTQAKRILDEDCISPHNIEDFDADKFISSLDEDLWDSICLLTQPTTDRSKNTQTRKIRRIFAVCTLLFTINRQCSSPLHTLTDAVETCGGSTRLLKLLNRLGVCASIETHSRLSTHHWKTLGGSSQTSRP